MTKLINNFGCKNESHYFRYDFNCIINCLYSSFSWVHCAFTVRGDRNIPYNKLEKKVRKLFVDNAYTIYKIPYKKQMINHGINTDNATYCQDRPVNDLLIYQRKQVVVNIQFKGQSFVNKTTYIQSQ